MKKTLFLLIVGGAFSLAQAASVFVDVYRDGTGREGMNQYTSNAAAILPLQDASGNDTSYTLKIVKSGGNFFNTGITAVTPGEEDPAYCVYYQNKAAMANLVNTLGSFDAGALSSYMAPGAGGSTTSSIQLGGLSVGDTVTFYMFVSSTAAAPGATTMTGGTGAFEYAATDGDGFSPDPSFTNGRLTLVKWTGKATAGTLDFHIGGQKAGAAAIAFAVVPEPAAASMGMLGLAALLMRRRRA